jgi:Protein of unknwon function (DUF3310)
MISEVDIKDWKSATGGSGYIDGKWIYPSNKPVDAVNHPPHYTQGGVECIVAIQAALSPAEFRGYCKGNALKYVWREQHKAGIESLQKAQWYLNKLIEVPVA